MNIEETNTVYPALNINHEKTAVQNSNADLATQIPPNYYGHASITITSLVSIILINFNPFYINLSCRKTINICLFGIWSNFAKLSTPIRYLGPSIFQLLVRVSVNEWFLELII